MNGLCFDIECCDGDHICEFGYVIFNENFKVIKKENILINPEKPFKLGRAGFDPRIKLSYTEEEYKSQPNFSQFHEKIENLLKQENQVLFGHSVSNDFNYLRIACKRYKFENYTKMQAYDTQKIYSIFNPNHESLKLENIIESLGIDVSFMTAHKASDDAETTMLIVKKICELKQITFQELLTQSNNCMVDNKTLSNAAKQRFFAKHIAELHNNIKLKENCKKICISSNIKVNNVYKRLEVIKRMFYKGFDYTTNIKECDFFVSNNNEGKQYESCKEQVDSDKEIKIISTLELSELLGIKINENCEFIRTKPTNNKTSKNSFNKNNNVNVEESKPHTTNKNTNSGNIKNSNAKNFNSKNINKNSNKNAKNKNINPAMQKAFKEGLDKKGITKSNFYKKFER